MSYYFDVYYPVSLCGEFVWGYAGIFFPMSLHRCVSLSLPVPSDWPGRVLHPSCPPDIGGAVGGQAMRVHQLSDEGVGVTDLLWGKNMCGVND